LINFHGPMRWPAPAVDLQLYPLICGASSGAIRNRRLWRSRPIENCGGAYNPPIGVPRSAVKITGDVKYYKSKSDSGNLTKRAFCPNCGSRLFSMPPFAPDLMVLTASSLDDPSIFQPAMDIYTSSAQPWDHMNASLPKFPKMPPTG
jgi:hypothetical protein